MKVLDNELYLTMMVISNAVAILLLIAAVNSPRIARVLFFLLFAWASWANCKTSQQTPQAYLDYANLALSEWYKDFILGWFSSHINWFYCHLPGLDSYSYVIEGAIV